MKKIIWLSLVLVIILVTSVIGCSIDTTTTTNTTTSTSKPSTTNTTTQSSTQQPIVATIQPPSDIKGNSQGVEYLQPIPMTQSIKTTKGAVNQSSQTLVPIITWGGDIATILANGGITTKSGSIFDKQGLNIKLSREDTPIKAVEKVISGQTPYLRGTMDMVTAATDALKDRGIDMVVVYQITWSTGGDTIVWKDVNSPDNLKGKTIGIQLYGPHMLYIATVLKDAGVSLNEVNIKWLRELSIPSYDTKGVAVDPMSAMQKDTGLSAVTVISPDMQSLTSGGTIGTGAENSVKGATLGLSTKTAGRIIADVYAVRKDYFDSNKSQVQKFVHGLMMAQEQLDSMVKTKGVDYQDLLKTSALILRDNAQATSDIEGLLSGDCTFVGYTGNVLFFGKDTTNKSLRDFPTLLTESQNALLGFGLITKNVTLSQSDWDYNVFTAGLKNTSGVSVATPAFDPTKVAQYVEQRQQTGSMQSGTLFSFDIYFEPNQNTFSIENYKDSFDKILALASTYPGAIIVVDGNADPTSYLSAKQKNNPQQILDQIKQAAKNLSLSRAIAVRDSLINYAKSKSIVFDPSQFTTIGDGINNPKFANPKTETEWKANMRVSFQIIQVEAESSSFAPVTGGN